MLADKLAEIPGAPALTPLVEHVVAAAQAPLTQ
jgi:hypothetical protein